MKPIVIAGLFALGCGHNELADYDACTTAYHVGQGVTQCLIMKFDWKAADAQQAGMFYDTWMAGYARDPASFYGRRPRNDREELTSMLRDLMLAQEVYWSAHDLFYFSNLDSLHWRSDIPAEITLAIEKAGRRGWRGRASKGSLTCAVFVGDSAAYAAPPAISELMTACDSIAPAP